MEKQSYKSQANKQQDRQVDQSEKLETFELSRQDQMRHLIQSEFIHRCKKNNAYSLRAFAKYLEVDQSYLSKILRGQRSINTKISEKIFTKLGLKPSEIAKAQGLKNGKYFQLVDDEFNIISDWLHFAIIELLKTNQVESSEQYISQRLNVHIEEVRSAISRLQRIGFLRYENNQMTLNSPNNTWSNNVMTTEARKTLQKKLLLLAHDAIETIPFELRDHGSLTVAINKNRLPEFKEKLKQIRQELGEYFQSDHELDEVYQLTVTFFPLTKIK